MKYLVKYNTLKLKSYVEKENLLKQIDKYIQENAELKTEITDERKKIRGLKKQIKELKETIKENK